VRDQDREHSPYEEDITTPEKAKFDEKAQKAFKDETGQATPLRLSATDLQNYDEIITISEGSLNSVLQLRFNKTLKNKDRRLREFNHAIS
jgi:hypothetical protein